MNRSALLVAPPCVVQTEIRPEPAGGTRTVALVVPTDCGTACTPLIRIWEGTTSLSAEPRISTVPPTTAIGGLKLAIFGAAAGALTWNGCALRAEAAPTFNSTG